MAVNRIVAPKFAVLYKNGDIKKLEEVIPGIQKKVLALLYDLEI